MWQSPKLGMGTWCSPYYSFCFCVCLKFSIIKLSIKQNKTLSLVTTRWIWRNTCHPLFSGLIVPHFTFQSWGLSWHPKQVGGSSWIHLNIKCLRSCKLDQVPLGVEEPRSWSSNVVPRPATSASPRNLLEIPGPPSIPTDPKLKGGAQQSVFYQAL